MTKSSVYVILKPNIKLSSKVENIVAEHNAMFDNSLKGTFLHFADSQWSLSFEDVSIVESFLATLPKSSFIFIRVSSLDDVEVAGSYFNNPYKGVLPKNLVDFLEEDF